MTKSCSALGRRLGAYVFRLLMIPDRSSHEDKPWSAWQVPPNKLHVLRYSFRLEHIITRNKHVKGAVMFGRGRLQNGVIIEPTSWTEFPDVKTFKDIVWLGLVSNIR